MPVPVVPEFDELARLFPDRDGKGRFLWQDYVERITERFDGLPAEDGGASFVRACLAAGCKAVPSIERSRFWETEAPPRMHPQRPVYELRVRLGLFFVGDGRLVLNGRCPHRISATWRSANSG